MNDERLDKTDKLFSIIQKIVTVSAIIIGGLWTYNMFIMHREAYPKADISYEIEEIKLTDEYTFLQIFIKIKNTGNTVLRLLNGNVRLLDVSFPHVKIEKELSEYHNSIPREKPTFTWKTIGKTE